MRRVPKLSSPREMPEEIAAVVAVIGNQARTAILHRLSIQPMTALDLAADLEVAHSSVHRNLYALERLGLVASNTPAGDRVGKTVVWSAVPEKIRALSEQWSSYASASGQHREEDR